MASRFLVGLDIGTASIKVVVAERQKDGRPLVRMMFKEPSQGLRKGTIIDLAEASQGVARVLGEVKKFSKAALQSVYISIGTPHMKAQPSHGITAVSRADTEIYQDDIDRVIRASQAVNLQPNRMIIHNVTREFIVDGVGDITDPLGLSGSRLEVQSFIIDVFSPHVKSVMRAVELTGAQIGGLVFGPLVASRSALSKRQKDLGVVLLDIGFGTTGMSVYEENKILGVALFPVGAGNITNDIAVGLKIPVEAAEHIKLGYGYAFSRDVGVRDSFELKKFIPDGRGTISRRFLAEIIESRLAEILQFVNNELKVLGKTGQLAGGAILVGGGSKLPGLTELVRHELKLTSRIGLSLSDHWLTENATFSEFLEDPEFVNAAGLVLWGTDQEQWVPHAISPRFSVKNVLRYFLP